MVTTSTKQIKVACLGASITEAKGSFDWIGELTNRPQNKKYHFFNLGKGGDTAFNALQRLPDVVAVDPDIVIVAVGWNDILTATFPNLAKLLNLWKKKANEPTPDWYRQNLQAIVRQLKAQTTARIVLTSLSPMGEDPGSTDPVQDKLNRLFTQYSEIVKQVAVEEGTGYIPLHEAFCEQIALSPGKAYTGMSIRSMYWNAIRQYILGRPLDDIARSNGWQFHVDGLHLNSRGGMILANLVQDFLDGG